MDVVVSVFALIVALGCVIALFVASRKDRKKDRGE